MGGETVTDRTCGNCSHCYLEDTGIYSVPVLIPYNLQGACDLVNPDDRHVGSYVQLDRARSCKQWRQCQYPRQVHPARPKQMTQKGQWWTDIERNAQLTLEDFA